MSSRPLSVRATVTKAPVVAPARAPDQPPTREVPDHHRDVAVAAEQLAPEVPLAERPEVEQRLQGPELADGEPGRAHDRLEPRGDRVRRPHQLDVGVQRGDFLGRSGVARRHSLN